MLTPDYLLHISEGAEEIAAQMHADMLKRIVAHIQARQKRGDTYILTAADKWQLEALQDAGYLRNDLAEDIAMYTNLQADEIRQAMEDAGVRTMAYDDRIYQQAGIADTKQPLSPYMTRLMQRNYEATMHEWSNYTRTTADAAQDWFVSAMDRVYNQVAFGGVGYIQAFAETIDDLAKTGLYINYPSGHRDTIETATLRCVRTGISQATAQIQERRMDEMGVDLVLVSSHMGARPSHQVWQGKVYSRSGASQKYPDFVSNTHYGSGDGLCGWNCRHQFMPYFEGMHNPFLRYDNKENRELYEATQTQRSMERSVRRTKRNLEVLQAAQDGDPDHADQYEGGIAKLKERLKLQRGAYYDFCERKDLRPLPERMRIAKAGRARPHDNVYVDYIKPNLTGGAVKPPTIAQPTVHTPQPAFNFAEDAKKIYGTMDKTDADLFQKQVNRSEGIIPKLYRMFANGLNRVTRKKGAGCYWNSTKNMEYDLNTPRNAKQRGVFATLSHEMGHAFDYEIGDGVGLTFDELDTVFAKHFHERHRASMSDQFLAAARKDRERLKDILKNDDVLETLNKDENSAGVQDAMDGFFNTQGKGILGWGHGNKYYNRKYRQLDIWGDTGNAKDYYVANGYIKKSASPKTEARIYDTASEMWANIASAVTEQGKQLEFVEQYMPNTLSEFRRIVDAI